MLRRIKRRVSKFGRDQVAPEDAAESNHKELQTSTSNALDSGAASDPTPDIEPESVYGLKELVAQPSNNAEAVDIIAIHGLDGTREGTWTDRNTRINWLCHHDFLPKSIPNARVLTFGYNSKSYFNRGNPGVNDFASELLASINSSRRTPEEKQRPIVFVCHSLGGLVFKKAIIKGHEWDTFYGSINKKICGVVFFGTPHKGSKLASWDTIGTRITQAVTLGFASSPSFVEGLVVDSQMLKQISESFVPRAGAYKIRSFYETLFMKGLNCRVVEEESARLDLPNNLAIASTSNHSNICKFPSANDQRYKNAIDAILAVMDTDARES
ncbi:hypothetical protein Trisim1_005960 [Trichoderma cf. simile WF8]